MVFQASGDSMSIPGLIAFIVGSVAIIAMVVGLGRLAKDAEDASRRRLLESGEAREETEALVHRLVYGESDDPTAYFTEWHSEADREAYKSLSDKS